MLDPATLVTENTDERTDRLIVALVRLHAPVLPVWQLAMPPTEKLPLTVALATAAPVLILQIVTVALAVRKDATAAGDAVVLAASASAAMPVTWGVAIDVPLIAGRQTNECLPPIHMAN